MVDAVFENGVKGLIRVDSRGTSKWGIQKVLSKVKDGSKNKKFAWIFGVSL